MARVHADDARCTFALILNFEAHLQIFIIRYGSRNCKNMGVVAVCAWNCDDVGGGMLAPPYQSSARSAVTASSLELTLMSYVRVAEQTELRSRDYSIGTFQRRKRVQRCGL